MFRAVATALASAVALLAIPSAADATHWPDYVVDDDNWNPPPGVTLRGINAPWVIDGQPYNICSDWDPLPPEIVGALADWEAVLPGVQFDYTCGGTRVLWIFSSAVHGPTPECQPGGIGCAWWWQEQDTGRGGSYTTSSATPETSTYVWVDTMTEEFQQNGLRYVVAHELGHIFGLDEKYAHDGGVITCGTTTATSIMDTARRLLNDFTSPVIGGCDGYQPTTGDISLVQQLYGHQQVQQLNTASLISDVVIGFKDTNWAEAHYNVAVYLYDDITHLFVYLTDFDHTGGIAGKGEYVRIPWNKPSAFYPEGVYRLCVTPESAVYIGETADVVCSNEYLYEDDVDGDGYTTVDELGAPFCEKVTNLDADEDRDGKVNDGCDNEGSSETGAQCDNAINDDPADDPLVNDGCPPFGDYSETDFDITTYPQYGCTAYTWSWPMNLVVSGNSMFRIDLADVTSFTVPVRHYDTSPPDPNYSMRWDLVPGSNLGSWINLQDITSVTTVRPPMYPYYGTKAFGGLPCFP